MAKSRGYLLETPTPTNETLETMLKSLAHFKMNLHRIKSKDYKETFKKIISLEQIQDELKPFFHVNSFPTTVFLSQLIKKLGQLGQLKLAMQVYQMILDRELYEPVLFNCSINALINQPECKKALEIFKKAKEVEKVNSITYLSIINVIATSRTPNKKLALEIADEAIEKKLVNTSIFNSTLHVLSKSPETNLDRALTLFNLAKEKYADHITYKKMLDIIALSDRNNTQLAYALLDEGSKHFPFPSFADQYEIDLHELTYGFVYYWLQREFQNLSQKTSDTLSITFIFGRGIHKKNNDDNTLQQALLDLVAEFKDNLSIGAEDSFRGTCVIVFQPSARKTIESLETKPLPKETTKTTPPQNSLEYSGRMFSAPHLPAPSSVMNDDPNKRVKQKCPSCVFL